MDRVYLSNTSGTPPIPPAVPATGYPQPGNPSTSQKATRLGVYWYHMITESLRNIIVAQGLEPDHENLSLLLEALDARFISPVELESRLGTLVTGMPIGMVGYWPGTTPPVGCIKRNGALQLRADFPLLYAMAAASGNIVSEANWAARPGSFSTGDGVTTFRVPMALGLSDRGYHDGNGTYDAQTGSALGAYRDSRNKVHAHSVWGDNSGSGANGQVASLNGGNFPIAASARTGGYQSIGGGGAQLIADEGGADGYPRHALYLPIIRAY